MSTAGATIVVTLDIGGSAAKASGYDVARQASLGSTATPYPARAADQDPGMFDPDSWWMAAVGALHDLRQLIDEPAGRFLGITVSAIRIPFVLLGDGGHAVMPGLLNRDMRAATQAAEIASVIGGDDVYRTTGHWPDRSSGCPRCSGCARTTQTRGPPRGPCCSCMTGSSSGCPGCWPASDRRRP